MAGSVEELHDLYRRANRPPGCLWGGAERAAARKAELRRALTQALGNLHRVRRLRRFGLGGPLPLGQLVRVTAMARRENVVFDPSVKSLAAFERALDATSHYLDPAQFTPQTIGAMVADGRWVSAAFAAAVDAAAGSFHRAQPWNRPIVSSEVLLARDVLKADEVLWLARHLDRHGEALGLRVPAWALDEVLVRKQLEPPNAVEECGICCDAPATARSCMFFLDHKNRHPVCTHRFCVDCLAEYISTAYANHKTHVGCPEPGCPCQILVGDARRIGGAALIAKAPKRLVHDAAAVDGEAVKQCPGCTLPIFRDKGCTEMRCTCGIAFHWHTLEVLAVRERYFPMAEAMATAAAVAPLPPLVYPKGAFWNAGSSAIIARNRLQRKLCEGRWVSRRFVHELNAYVDTMCAHVLPSNTLLDAKPLRSLVRRTAKPVNATVVRRVTLEELDELAPAWLDRGTRVNDIARD